MLYIGVGEGEIDARTIFMENIPDALIKVER